MKSKNTVPAEAVYAYALLKVYDTISKRYKNKLYSNQLQVSLKYETLNEYITLMKELYQDTYGSDIEVKNVGSYMNFGASILSENMMMQSLQNGFIVERMFERDDANNSLKTTRVFNPQFVEKNLKLVLPKEVQDILESEQLSNVIKDEKFTPSKEELTKIEYYKLMYKTHSETQLDKELKIYEDTYNKHHKTICDTIMTYLSSKGYQALDADKIDLMAKNIELLAPDLTFLTKRAQAVVASTDALNNQGLNKFEKNEITRSAKINEYFLFSNIDETYRKQGLDHNVLKVEETAIQMMSLANILPSIDRVVSSMRECQLHQIALKQVIDVKVINRKNVERIKSHVEHSHECSKTDDSLSTNNQSNERV